MMECRVTVHCIRARVPRSVDAEPSLLVVRLTSEPSERPSMRCCASRRLPMPTAPEETRMTCFPARTSSATCSTTCPRRPKATWPDSALTTLQGQNGGVSWLAGGIALCWCLPTHLVPTLTMMRFEVAMRCRASELEIVPLPLSSPPPLLLPLLLRPAAPALER